MPDISPFRIKEIHKTLSNAGLALRGNLLWWSERRPKNINVLSSIIAGSDISRFNLALSLKNVYLGISPWLNLSFTSIDVPRRLRLLSHLTLLTLLNTALKHN